ncbi:MAG: TetR/AcrR family transcriptional regulator [Sphaerochaeta sp.]|jgi:AcrR family transcriptional regulator|nr:TetR/AcrR family transcriptional regulator [Sphaerochaeta sp.]MCH3919976.1 TetR/AcrR family transcriptional regulator [Sphaerochaeta sp.]MCI2045962.1 TetR/AcrR family transcriptional regulator [Sphaerochaeta sp.]MCI2076713.1 TetR/AcrR family transcriptional regulator [Sphaerochaeta sp.]MCI2097839.1 TetR/AcrR family transcriptional regulator [Sphaerochaeta sp.]
MEDRRIKKTKQSLKDAMIRLLDTTPFERINVTALCKEADVSRITFYTYYRDKYEFVDAIFNQFLATVKEEMAVLQRKTNPTNDPVQAFCNLMDVLLETYFRTEYGFFKHLNSRDNPYLFFSFYWFMLKQIETFAEETCHSMHPKYPLERVNSFLSYGLWGFIHTSHEQGVPLETTREEVKGILKAVLASELFNAR